jgi:hypothetical protein
MPRPIALWSRAAPDLDTLLKDYKSTVSISHAEVFDRHSANIESRAVRSRLANGMKVVVLPRRLRPTWCPV